MPTCHEIKDPGGRTASRCGKSRIRGLPFHLANAMNQDEMTHEEMIATCEVARIETTTGIGTGGIGVGHLEVEEMKEVGETNGREAATGSGNEIETLDVRIGIRGPVVDGVETRTKG